MALEWLTSDGSSSRGQVMTVSHDTLQTDSQLVCLSLFMVMGHWTHLSLSRSHLLLLLLLLLIIIIIINIIMYPSRRPTAAEQNHVTTARKSQYLISHMNSPRL
jgi:hypothetical protein